MKNNRALAVSAFLFLAVPVALATQGDIYGSGGGGLSSATGWTLDGTGQTVTAAKVMTLPNQAAALTIGNVVFDGRPTGDGILIGPGAAGGNVIQADNTNQAVQGPPLRLIDARSGNDGTSVVMSSTNTTDTNRFQLTWQGSTTNAGAATGVVFGKFGFEYTTHDNATFAGAFTLKTAVAGAAAAEVFRLAGGNLTLGTATLNPTITSAFTATAGVDDFLRINGTPTGASDNLVAFQGGGTTGMSYGQTSGSAGAPELRFGASVLKLAIVSGQAAISSTATASGSNISARSACNAAGESCFSAGSSSTLTSTGLDATAIQADNNGAIVLSILESGHLSTTGAPAGSVAAGTCTGVSGTVQDLSASIVATCTVGQTLTITWARQYSTTAPRCTIGPTNSPAALANFFFTPAAATTMTITAAVGNASSSTFDIHCFATAT